MWPFTPRLKTLRQKALQTTQSDTMRAFLSSPLIDKKKDWRETRLVSIDLETTGLDPVKDSIISIGLVELDHEGIHLDTAWHKIINVNSAMPEESTVIHQITDDRIAEGEPLAEVMPELLKRLQGKVILVHYAFVEKQFIHAACMNLYGSPFITQIIDTLEIAQRRMHLRNHTIQANNLRLYNLRKVYNLPAYKAHNALWDAIATAELFMAMTADIAPKGPQPLRDYLI